MRMLMLAEVVWAVVARRRGIHSLQDARRIPSRHINNSYLYANAKDSQRLTQLSRAWAASRPERRANWGAGIFELDQHLGRRLNRRRIRRSAADTPEGGVPASSHVPLMALLITNGHAGPCTRMRWRN